MVGDATRMIFGYNLKRGTHYCSDRGYTDFCVYSIWIKSARSQAEVSIHQTARRRSDVCRLCGGLWGASTPMTSLSRALKCLGLRCIISNMDSMKLWVKPGTSQKRMDDGQVNRRKSRKVQNLIFDITSSLGQYDRLTHLSGLKY